jgi:acyl-CoA thioesterase-1
MSDRNSGWTTLALLGSALLLSAGAAQAQSVRVVALGDSNTAGFGVGSQAAFPARLEGLLRSAGLDVQVLNAGISGDTTAGMLARLDSAVPPGTSLVVVQGGYNDLRRGGTRDTIAANVEAILGRLRARGVRAVLCGFYNEPWGALARRNGAVLVDSSTCYDPGNRGFDELHMNAAGHQVVAARLFPVVQPLLAGPRRRRG